MATLPEEQIAPVAAVNPVATAAPQPTLAPITASQVYDPTNIQQINIPSNKRAMDMKLSTLEKKLSKATSIAELNQIGIMNQPKAMGVLTGEAAYRDKLDTARVNAFNSLYNNRIQEEQRKEAERQSFISTYGADPKMRPSGMSKREFQKALAGGGFSNLLTEDFKQKQLETKAKLKSLSGGGIGAPGANKELAATADAFTKFNGDWGQTANYLASQGYDVSSGSVIDNELRRRNGLAPIIPLTAAQQTAQIEAEAIKQKGIQTATKALGILGTLEQSGSLGAAVGPISSKIPTVRGGTADFEANFNALKSLLTLENMGVMKGVLSDSDMKVITQAATPLSLGMSEFGFKNELQNVRTILETRLSQVQQGQKPMSDEEAYAEYLKTVK